MNSTTEQVWNRLAFIRSLSFVARSGAEEMTGWTGQAEGQVEVLHDSAECLRFVESGSWSTPMGKAFAFSNTYRWTLTPEAIRLEHLRFGPEKPVYLFDLIPDGALRMVSANPHVCSEDLYEATLVLGMDLKLNWRVTGPKMNESIEYCYRS